MKRQPRISKEIKLDDLNFKSTYGTFNRNTPNVIYINGKTKVKPIIEKTDYSVDSRNIKKSFTNFVDKTVKDNDIFFDEYICTCDVSENGLEYGKKSNLKYSVFLKPKELKPIEDYLSVISNFNATVTSFLSEELNERGFETKY